MPHETALIATVAAGLGLAFIFGFAASRLGLPPLVGYLMAGVALGSAPGDVADPGLAAQLAEIGVILLMFGVGLHFSLRDLLAVRRVAVPGALIQIVLATAVGALAARAWGWAWGGALVFGLALSVASTVVMLRALEGRGGLDSVNGRIAVGWLIVQDLAMVLALVLLPALVVPLGGAPPAGAGPHAGVLATVVVTLAKVIAFLVVMLVAGRRTVPWLLERVARTGSRELFTLSVLASALGIAVGAAALFGVSFALGAFFAGVVISESDLSHQAAADALPLQDAFAVLFFVSVGMLFDPSILVREPLHVVGTVAVIAVGQTLAALGIVLAYRHPLRTALTVAASLGQIGEFSFILAGLGVSLGLLPREGQSLVLAGALLTITLNPLLFEAIAPVERWFRARPALLDAIERPHPLAPEPGAPPAEGLHDHVVVVGHGRVGGTVARALAHRGVPYVVVEQNRLAVEALRRRGVRALYGDATRPGVLAQARLGQARLVVVAAPEPYQAREIVRLARRANPGIDTVVRTHSAAEQSYLEQAGVGRAVLGERELALGMAHYALRSLGQSEAEADAAVQATRADDGAGTAAGGAPRAGRAGEAPPSRTA